MEDTLSCLPPKVRFAFLCGQRSVLCEELGIPKATSNKLEESIHTDSDKGNVRPG
jgi:hypothetical protein